jgi:2-C-methyl-D-erythritol 4-phosphate cytidylyltransferase
MTIALLFAGGTGRRMNSHQKPKQFLEIHGKPIIMYTIEVFEQHPEVDKIAVVCIKEYIDELKKFLHRYEVQKTETIAPGGKSGFESILNGLFALEAFCKKDDIVIIHDGVRPLVSAENISESIESAKKYGTGITIVPVTESGIISENGETIDEWPNRSKLYSTKAPQTFKFGIILDLYKKAAVDGFEPIESAHLCHHYGLELHTVKGESRNIKITTSSDYYIFRALYNAVENDQIIGY